MARKATNPQNLRSFKKGVSGNPAGRPKKLPDLDVLLQEVLGEHINKTVAMKAILIALRKKALSGDTRASELLLDRGYGRLKQSTGIEVELTKLSEAQLDQIISRLLQ